MEVLRPTLINIDGRCYRKNPTKSLDDAPYQEEEDVNDFETQEYCEESCTLDVNLEQTDAGFRYSMQLPSAFFRFIIGKKGETKKRIENETNTQVRIPRQGEEGDVVIIGRDRKGVMSAKTRIEVLVQSARRKTPFTHFLSFPVTSTAIKDKFLDFKEDVLRACNGDRGIDGTIFQNADKLHLTVGVLALMSEAEVAQAVDLLQQCQTDLIEPILNGQQLLAEFKGLEYMNDDPDEVDVLYAKVVLSDGSDRLQNLADRLVDKFVSSGLMQQDYDRVKLHVTVMNTLMRKDPSGAFVPKRSNDRDFRRMKDRESFSAGNLLKRFDDYEFGTHRIESVHLSQKHKLGPNGYYACAGRADLP